MPKEIVCFQGYGRLDIIKQVALSVCSIKQLNPFQGVVIYTDDVEWFQNFFQAAREIEIRKLDADRIQQWKGPHQFVHRLKLEMLLDALRPGVEKLIYADGDTFFKSNLDAALFSSIDERTTLLHCFEYIIEEAREPLGKKIKTFLKQQEFMNQGERFRIPIQTGMWNAGIIGLHTTHRHLLQKALETTDAIYPIYPKHIIEQLAVSWVLETHSYVKPAVAFVDHYWGAKEAWDLAINGFLNIHPTFDSAIKNWDRFPKDLPIEKSPKKSLWQKLQEVF